MRKSPLGLVVAAIVCFPTLISQAAGPAPAALKTFLEREGFGGSPFQRRFGNHLFATTLINGRKTGLMIDSGCPITRIDRASAPKRGLLVQEPEKYSGGVTGEEGPQSISKI